MLFLQEVFAQLLGLLEAVARQANGKQVLLGCPRSLKQLRGVTQLLARRMDIESKYIQRLEGKVALVTSWDPAWWLCRVAGVVTGMRMEMWSLAARMRDLMPLQACRVADGQVPGLCASIMMSGFAVQACTGDDACQTISSGF